MAIDNKQVARRLIDEVWNKGKLEVIEELCDPSYEGHDPLLGTAKREGLRDSVRAYRSAFPDLQLTINAILVDGNFVVTRWTARGTHLGPLMGLPSTGRSASVTGVNIAEIRNGKVLTDYSEFDALGLMRQLGQSAAVQPPPQKATVPETTRRP